VILARIEEEEKTQVLKNEGHPAQRTQRRGRVEKCKSVRV
jgi:hypothetical protein